VSEASVRWYVEELVGLLGDRLNYVAEQMRSLIERGEVEKAIRMLLAELNPELPLVKEVQAHMNQLEGLK
jgi:predicted component of type VI protein secretion system